MNSLYLPLPDVNTPYTDAEIDAMAAAYGETAPPAMVADLYADETLRPLPYAFPTIFSRWECTYIPTGEYGEAVTTDQGKTFRFTVAGATQSMPACYAELALGPGIA